MAKHGPAMQYHLREWQNLPTANERPFMNPFLSSVSTILTAISESLFPFILKCQEPYVKEHLFEDVGRTMYLRSFMLAEPMMAILSSTMTNWNHTTVLLAGTNKARRGSGGPCFSEKLTLECTYIWWVR